MKTPLPVEKYYLVGLCLLFGLVCTGSPAHAQSIQLWIQFDDVIEQGIYEIDQKPSMIVHQPAIRTAELNTVVRYMDYDYEPALRSESRARNLSLVFTGIPVLAGLFSRGTTFQYASTTFGLILGPSAGLYYAGNRNQAGGGILLRALGGGTVTLGGLYLWWGAVSGSDGIVYLSLGAMVVGGLIVAYSALHDTFTRGPRAVRAYNESLNLSLSPWVNPETGSPGLSLNLRF